MLGRLVASALKFRPKSLATAAASRSREPAIFAIVGALSTAVDYGVYFGLTRLAFVDPLVANGISYSAGSLNGYVLNGRWTFRNSGTTLLSLAPILRFVASTGLSLAVSTLSMFLLLQVMSDVGAKLLTTLVSFSVNYSLGRFFIYRPVPLHRGLSQAHEAEQASSVLGRAPTVERSDVHRGNQKRGE